MPRYFIKHFLPLQITLFELVKGLGDLHLFESFI
jgi:hypothetical protein